MSAALTSLPTVGQTPNDSHGTGQQTRRRILIVDDDAGVLFALRRLFGTLDLDVETCADPYSSLKLMQDDSTVFVYISYRKT
jgi:ActR/RegA family two-component response regulator